MSSSTAPDAGPSSTNASPGAGPHGSPAGDTHADTAQANEAQVNSRARSAAKDVLLAAAARVQGPSDPPVVSPPVDWGWLAGQARKHDLEPLLHRLLATVGTDRVPEAVRAGLRRRAGLLAVESMHRARELVRVVRLLEDEGFPALPVKGPVLAQRAYGDLALRPAADLDVLVRPEHFEPALRALRSAGYAPVGEAETSSDAWQAYVAHHRSCELYHWQRRVPLELHHAFFPQGEPAALPAEAAWARHERAPFLGTTIRRLAPEDRLLYLCAHGTWHRWAKLKWVADIAGLLARRPALDGDALRRRAKDGGALRRVRLGMGLARELLGAPVLAGWRRDLDSDPVLSKLIRTVRAQWLYTYRTTDADPWTTLRFQLRARERWRDRWAFLRRQLPLLLGPSEQDRAVVPLPKALGGLYVFVRPLRILWERMMGTPDTDSHIEGSQGEGSQGEGSQGEGSQGEGSRGGKRSRPQPDRA